MVALICWPGIDGVPPSWPAEICAFCAVIAEAMSLGVSLNLSSRFGSSQTRIAYCEPNTCTVPTPLTRLIGSRRLATT